MIGKESAVVKKNEEKEALPEHLRCNRNDGKKWRCRGLVMANKKVCEIHYLQYRHRNNKKSSKLYGKKKHKKNHIDVFKMQDKMKKKPNLSSNVNTVNGMMEGEGEGSCAVDITRYNLENRIMKLEKLVAKLKAAKLGSKA